MESNQKRVLLFGALALAVVVIGAVLLFSGGDGDEDVEAGDTTTTSEAEETTTSSEAEDTTTSSEVEDTTTTTEAEETTTSSEAEDTTTSSEVEDPLDPITVDLEGDIIVFDQDVECIFGPGFTGEITGTAEDETTIEVLLDDATSTVAIDGASGTYDAMVTDVSDDEIIITIEAEPPKTEILVDQAVCELLEDG